MKKSTEIKTELDNATKRLGELAEMRDGITANVETLQKGFIDGNTPLEELQAEQGKLTILNESIKALETKQDELHTAFQKASHNESQTEIMNRLKSLVAEAEKTFSNRETIRLEFDAVIGKYARSLFEASERLGANAQDFRRNLKQLSPENQKQMRSGVINSAAFSLLENGNQKSPNQFEFPDVINTTEMILAQQKHRADQKEEQAIFAAERAKKAADLEAKRLEEKRIFDEALDAERKRITSYRVKNKMPHLSAQEIDSFARESLAKGQTAQIAEMRGATVNV
jgi:uncharacterized phage infection (PIP) family protein YhgE